MELQFESVVRALDAALELVEDEEQRARLRRVIGASRASVERASQDVLAQVVADINERLAGRARVDLRHTPGGVEVSVAPYTPAADLDEDEPWEFADSELEKLTLRVPVELKDRATAAAKESGLSVNAWFTRLLARELRTPGPGTDLEDEGEDEDQSGRRGRGRHRRRHGRGASLKGWVGQ